MARIMPALNGKDRQENSGERVAKRIARAGLCSRREAEQLIAAGRVMVDGKTLTTPATLVSAQSHITIDGKPLAERQETRLWLYHKPRGLVTTHRDPQGRQTVFAALKQDLPRVISVGRLDLNSEGLLLLTNDGALSRLLELPSTGWRRRYRVRVFGKPDEKALAALEKGVTVDGTRYGPIAAHVERVQGANCWLSVTLTEGKNREIRRVLAELDLQVNRLIRIAFGPFQLGNLAPGEVKEVSPRVIRDQLGVLMAKASDTKPSTGSRSKGGTEDKNPGRKVGTKLERQSRSRSFASSHAHRRRPA
jgi:23S rRNA pseudouridine2605 synthase